MAAGASMWSTLIRSLPSLAYVKTLGFMCTMYVIRTLFWFGFWCGVALTLAVGGIFLYTILGMRGVRKDPSSPAVSPLKTNDILETKQNGGYQDVTELNKIITVLWPSIAKPWGARIKDIANETVDGILVDTSKHISLSATAFLKFGRAIDQVFLPAKKKFQDKIASSLSRLGSKRVIMREMNFGTKPPEITALRFESGVDEFIFETKFLWESEGATSRLSIDIIRPLDIIQVKNVRLQGTIKIVLKGCGALVVSLNGALDIGFDVTVLNDLSSPYMKKKIQENIEYLLMETLVWPSRFVLPLSPGEDFSFLESRAVGVLRVRLIKAEDIIHTHHIVKVCYFVKMFVHHLKIKCCTSRKSSERGVWDETLTVEVEDKETQTLTLQLSRVSRVKGFPNKYIGFGKLPIKQFQPGVKKNLSCNLEGPGSKTNGICRKLSLAITYCPL